MFGKSKRNGSYVATLLSLTATMMYTTQVLAQTNGTCVCQPGAFEIQLDATLTCENRTIVPGLPGISDAVCVVTNGVTDFDEVPVSFLNVTVKEIAANIDTLSSQTYLAGEAIQYTSFGINDTESALNGTIPTGLSVSIYGLNAANEIISNIFVILYTNDCLTYPIFTAGSTIGWASFVTVDPPSPDLCPAFVPEPESTVPSSLPSIVPSSAPSDSVSTVPSSAPSDSVSTIPSSVPSLSPTTEKCNCQPGTITFNFDFTLTCDDRDVLSGNPGIYETECLVLDEEFLQPTDPFPVTVETITIFEVSQTLDTLQQANFTGPFESGDSVTYESFAATNTLFVLAGVVPYGIQVTIVGTNAAGETITNSYVVLYTNECNVYPVLPDGSTIGWTSLSPVTGPPESVCPAYIATSTVPSIVPSNSPVMTSTVPSTVPSSVPVMAETDSPVTTETDTPIASPVVAPAPIESPIEPPTDIVPPTCAPISTSKGKTKKSKGKGESDRLLRTGGGVECPEDEVGIMKKEKKVKENMSMDLVKKGMGKKKEAPKEAKGKVAPKEAKGESKKEKGMKGKEKGMGMGKDKSKQPKEEKAPKKDMTERRQLRPTNQ